MTDARHEFRVEPWGGIDREARYDEERVYARRLRARQLLGVGAVLVAKASFTWLTYHVFGWWGIGVLVGFIIIVLFIRGTHAYPGTDR